MKAKDLTTLFSMRDDKVKKILGELSSIFDGSFHKHTGTRGAIDYTDIAFSMIACITTAALSDHHRYLSTIGPRFLTYASLPLNQPEREAGFDLLHKSNGNRKAKRQQLRQLVATLGNQILATPVSPMSIPDHLFKDLTCLATLLACGRSAITYRINEGSYKREIEHIQTEEPWRAFQQLQNLAFSLAHIHGRSTVTPHEMELVRRVALFSMPHDRSEVLRLFGQYPHELSVDCCATGINKSESRARQLLDELHQVKLVSKISGTNNKHTYYPANEYAELVCKPIQPIDHILEV